MRTKSLFKYSFILFFLIFCSKNIQAQCFEIQSVLIDACGTPEGENEMVAFKVGGTALNTTNLNIIWPNTTNQWQGVAPNATTVAKVNQINTTITGCGIFIQPTSGVLPAGSTVLLVTSTNFNNSIHTFSAITDTIYIIFQTAASQNSMAGHFANFNSMGGMRTLSMRFGGSCTDAVTYDRAKIQNIDGATAVYTPDGTATYITPGCTVPVREAMVDAGTNATVCRNAAVMLSGISQNAKNVYWSGGSGAFSNKNIDQPSYTPDAADKGTIKLYFNARTPCDTITDSITVTINELPNAQIISPIPTVCYNVGEVVNLNATSINATSVLWTTNVTGTIINANTNNASYTILAADAPNIQFIFTATNACGNTKDTLSNCIGKVPRVVASANNNPACEGENVQLKATLIDTLPGTYTFVWKPATGLNNANIRNPFFTASQNIKYTVKVMDASNNVIDTDFVNITANAKPMLITSDNVTIKKGENASLMASGGFTYVWSGGNGLSCYDCANPIASPEATTTYQVIASNTNGCSDSSLITVTVELDSFKLEIPNVFTPNGDGKNDIFEFSYSGVKSFNIQIFNRWGEKIYESEKTLTERWKGNNNSGTTVPDGIYIYMIEAEDLTGKIIQKNGSIAVYK